MNNDNIEVIIEGVNSYTSEIKFTNNNIANTNIISDIVYDLDVDINNTNIDVNVETVNTINEIEVQNNINSFNVDVNIIQEETLYELTFKTLTFSGSISQSSDNRIVLRDDGLYSPEITLDLVSIYELAKS